MENEVDPEILRTTQNTLGKYVKRPPLSDKLLKKPPFRFLHDIITTVLKTTGFFEGLFEQDELISENVKDRDSKILFLTKVITVVGLATGKNLSVKPSKVIAGQEVEKTNLLLQVIADAIDKKLSSHDAVQKYKESLKSPVVRVNNVKEEKVEPDKEKASKKSVTKKPTEIKKTILKSSEKVSKAVISDKPGVKLEKPLPKSDRTLTKITKSPTNKVNQKENTSTTKESTKKSVSKQKENEKIKKAKDTRQNSIDIQNETKHEIVVSPIVDEDSTSRNKNVEEARDISGQEQNNDFTNKDNENDQVEKAEAGEENILNTSLSSTDLMPINNPVLEDSNLAETYDAVEETNASLNGSSRMVSAVNEVEKNREPIKDQWNQEIERINVDHKKETTDFPLLTSSWKKNDNENKLTRPASVRPSSSRPGAPRPREKLEHIINEPESILVGKVNIITESTPNEEDEDSSILIVDESSIQKEGSPETLNLSSADHGHLVQQILDSQKELTQASSKTEIEWHFGAQKAREATNVEIEQMRYNIQALSRAANPLGKLLDHVQEDVEIMRQELQQWTLTYEKTAKEVAKQKTINEEALLPLHTKLKQLDVDIEEKYGKINDLKIEIQKKSLRIDKLLATGNVQ